jgi:hypothetical protein
LRVINADLLINRLELITKAAKSNNSHPPGRIMELYQLKLFVDLAEKKNFTQVANENYVTQAAVTLQIRKLESELGVPVVSSHHARRHASRSRTKTASLRDPNAQDGRRKPKNRCAKPRTKSQV